MTQVLGKKFRKGKKQKNRQLLLNISMFLLSHEALRKSFWNVKSVTYDKQAQVIKIGINTTTGKLGTTLKNLRSTAKDLSKYLYKTKITFKLAKIIFFVDKEDLEMERIHSIIEDVKVDLTNY